MNIITNEKKKVLHFWSGGKNSALALHLLNIDPRYEVVGLVSIFDREKNTVKFHGVPDSLVMDQAKMLNLPVQRIFLPPDASKNEYIDHVGKILAIFAKKGIHHVSFGDSHLEDTKTFKEEMLRPLNMTGIFPLWHKSSEEINEQFFKTGHKALVTSVITNKLDNSFLACEFNQNYIDRLPKDIDPAGENGEFHTFVTYGPAFKMRVPFSKSIAIEEGPYLVSLLKEP